MGKLLGWTSPPDPEPRDFDWNVWITFKVSSITLSTGKLLATICLAATIIDDNQCLPCNAFL